MIHRKSALLIRRQCLPLSIAFLILVTAASALSQNAISGMVFDTQKKPVSDVEVELLDGFERLIASRKTSGSGFYTFQRLNAGIYYLRIRPGATNFKESKQRVDLGDLNAIGGVDQKQVDIFLETETRRKTGTPEVTGVVFVQDVPEDARRALDRARKIREKRPDEAFEILGGALAIFPDYFEALEAMGDVSLDLKRFQEAASAYERAVKVNSRCFGCYFNLGVALNQLGEKKKAADALRSANEVDSGSINSHLLLGIVFRDLRSFEEAEAALLRAKELAGNKQPDVNWQLAELYYFDLKRPKLAVVELKNYLENLTSEEKREHRKKIESVKQLIRKIEAEV
jgi:tetratricopeptide (TPR) repeat protein